MQNHEKNSVSFTFADSGRGGIGSRGAFILYKVQERVCTYVLNIQVQPE